MKIKNLNLELLFPGLDGVIECHWKTEGLTLDELLEEYRALSTQPQNKHWLLKEADYITWIDDLFQPTMCNGACQNHTQVQFAQSR